MKKAIEAARAAIAKYRLIKRGDGVLACVSGGADSTALLYILSELRGELGLSELRACHFNHGLRGKASDSDERFTLELCCELGVECTSERADMSSRERPRGMSVEAWARALRYEFFERTAHGRGLLIATAHNRDDVAETVLFNLARGAGLEGAGGILPKRGNIIRPLIDVSRADIEDYLAARGARWAVDESNLSDCYARNRIRHAALPALESVNAAASRNIARFAERAREADAYLSRLALAALERAERGSENALARFEAVPLNGLEEPVRSLAVKLLCERFRRDVGEDTIAPALEVLGGALRELQLAEKTYLRREGDYIAVYRRESAPESAQSNEIELREGDNFFRDGVCVRATRIALGENAENINKYDLINAADCDKINGKLVVRARRAGDVFHDKRRRCSKTLKKLFNERKVPERERGNIPVACDEGGIVWLAGEGVDASRAADINSREIILFETVKREEE